MKTAFFFATMSLIMAYFASGVGQYFPNTISEYNWQQMACLCLFWFYQFICIGGIIYQLFRKK